MVSSRSSSETPLMRQYLEVKERHPDCVVFFRVGDFYEMFFDDAVRVSRALDLTLTTRDKGKDDPVPMCGVPHHAARQYLGRLVDQGFKVAVCDQLEDPRLARGIVKRDVTRILTPGVVTDEEQLEARAGRYLAALAVEGAAAGFAYLDVTTGEFAATEIDPALLEDEVGRVGPREILAADEESAALAARWAARAVLTRVPAVADAPRLLEEGLGDTLASFRIDGWPLAVRAAALCLAYARSTHPAGEVPAHRVVPYRAAEHLLLDEATQLHLEVFTAVDGSRKTGTLLGLIDRAETAMGSRVLRRWLAAPLLDVAAIRRRQDAVELLVERAALRATLRQDLSTVHDLERLIGRVTLGVASPRDLGALRRSLEAVPAIVARIEEAARDDLALPELIGPRSSDDLCGEVAADVAATLVDDPPALLADGDIIRPGHSPELDELVDIASGGRGQILAIEARERERTSIPSLKIRYNRVFGYYIEITRSHFAKVPPDYVRKQTLANCERFTTPELTEHETKVLGAEERRVVLEGELFDRLRQRVAAQARRLQALAARVATLDALAGLAEAAHTLGYVRPEVDEGLRLEIVDGRHPVVERLAAAGKFVPNDVTLDPDDAQLLVVTGPNMSGKSTAMRQVGLIVLLAQAGSFVPARQARIGLVDRVFTRVGASDNLSRGESTFMVEMRETAHILAFATRRSLLLLDEIGRGTSTYDGVSIAWAVAEHIHDRVGAKTMFATHYHELTSLAQVCPRARNVQVAVREWKDEIVFLHKLVDGGASRSYGIQVGRLAGLPRRVVDRARAVLAALERGDDVFGRARLPVEQRQISLFGPQGAPARPPLPPAVAEAVARLREVDVDELSPRAAHALLADLRERLADVE